MKKWIKSFKNIKLKVLLVHLIITLVYPLAKAFTAESNGLLIFTDTLTIIACILLIGAVIYGFVLHGDFDVSAFVMRRASKHAPKQTFAAYKQDRNEKREEAFNYPLFLGLVYIVVSLVIAYVFY